jgi:cyclopropane fatty-acyl-phospholipid synthase-like methyltransferase
MASQISALEQCYLRTEQSATAARYRERTHGKALNQFNSTDMTQLTLLADLLHLHSSSVVLDAGCGTGHVTKYLADTTGARFVGIDVLAGCIRRAQELAQASAGRLEFVVADMETPDFPPASFDAVIAIESLYPITDHTPTLAAFKKLLHPDGQMGLFYTHFSDSPGTGLGPDDTRLAEAFRNNALRYHAHDLTEHDRAFWQRCDAVAEQLRPDFIAEGNASLLIDGERLAILGLIQQNRHARYLYHVASLNGGS